MSNHTEQFERRNKGGLKAVGATVAVVAGIIGIGGAAKAWFILPYRIDLLEVDTRTIKQEYKDLSREQQEMKLILMRIDERLKRRTSTDN